MRGRRGDRHFNRPDVVAVVAGGASFLAAPAIVAAPAPLSVSFVQQRGLLYLPVDMMVTGGVLQEEATGARARQGRGVSEDIERPGRRHRRVAVSLG